MGAGETYDYLLTPASSGVLRLQLQDLIFGRPPVTLDLMVE